MVRRRFALAWALLAPGGASLGMASCAPAAPSEPGPAARGPVPPDRSVGDPAADDEAMPTGRWSIDLAPEAYGHPVFRRLSPTAHALYAVRSAVRAGESSERLWIERSEDGAAWSPFGAPEDFRAGEMHETHDAVLVVDADATTTLDKATGRWHRRPVRAGRTNLLSVDEAGSIYLLQAEAMTEGGARHHLLVWRDGKWASVGAETLGDARPDDGYRDLRVLGGRTFYWQTRVDAEGRRIQRLVEGFSDAPPLTEGGEWTIVPTGAVPKLLSWRGGILWVGPQHIRWAAPAAADWEVLYERAGGDFVRTIQDAQCIGDRLFVYGAREPSDLSGDDSTFLKVVPLAVPFDAEPLRAEAGLPDDDPPPSGQTLVAFHEGVWLHGGSRLRRFDPGAALSSSRFPWAGPRLPVTVDRVWCDQGRVLLRAASMNGQPPRAWVAHADGWLELPWAPLGRLSAASDGLWSFRYPREVRLFSGDAILAGLASADFQAPEPLAERRVAHDADQPEVVVSGPTDAWWTLDEDGRTLVGAAITTSPDGAAPTVGPRETSTLPTFASGRPMLQQLGGAYWYSDAARVLWSGDRVEWRSSYEVDFSVERSVRRPPSVLDHDGLLILVAPSEGALRVGAPQGRWAEVPFFAAATRRAQFAVHVDGWLLVQAEEEKGAAVETAWFRSRDLERWARIPVPPAMHDAQAMLACGRAVYAGGRFGLAGWQAN